MGILKKPCFRVHTVFSNIFKSIELFLTKISKGGHQIIVVTTSLIINITHYVVINRRFPYHKYNILYCNCLRLCGMTVLLDLKYSNLLWEITLNLFYIITTVYVQRDIIYSNNNNNVFI